jgi:hypothetical protein
MEVKLGIGLGDISFGIAQDSLKDLIGEHDKIDRDNDDQLLLMYNGLKCTYWMDENGRLHWIQCSNPSLILHNVKVIGMEVLEAVSKLALVLESSYEFEDYGSMESYSFPDYEMEVQSEYGIVTTVCFGHYWSGDKPLYTNA